MSKSNRDSILDTALELGSQCGWEALTLHDIARERGTKLAEIHAQFPQKDDLVDAWLDRADAQMLQHFPAERDETNTGAERLTKVIQTWLDALSQYHKLTGEMLLYKLEPGHIHLQAAGILRISRTVQWFREAAELKASGAKRIGQEIALSSLFIGMFIYWLNDRSTHQQQTRNLLRKRLANGDRMQLWQ